MYSFPAVCCTHSMEYELFVVNEESCVVLNASPLAEYLQLIP